MVTLAAVARQNKAMKDAQSSSTTSRVPHGDNKDPKYAPINPTDRLSEEDYLKQALPGFYNTARVFCLDHTNPKHKPYLDGMIERAKVVRRERIKKLKEEGRL
jgi:hypothetical protein